MILKGDKTGGANQTSHRVKRAAAAGIQDYRRKHKTDSKLVETQQFIFVCAVQCLRIRCIPFFVLLVAKHIFLIGLKV